MIYLSDKIIRIKEIDNYRIVVISDIHAHLNEFKNLIDKLELSEEDYLIILGDFLNRGYDSLGTFEYIVKLSKRDRTFILKGNHESFMQKPYDVGIYLDRILEFLKNQPYETFIAKLCERDGNAIQNFDDGNEFREYVLTRFDRELDFIRNLPILLYFDDMLFVHGGYSEDFHIENDEIKFLKYDFFEKVAKAQERLTIVGHIPTCVLRKDEFSNLPYFNWDKNIISIDGGMGVKRTGEINALIITKRDGVRKFDCVQQNNFKLGTIIGNFDFPNRDRVYLHWPNREVELVKRGEKMSVCYSPLKNKKFSVFNEIVSEKDDKYNLNFDYQNKFFNLPIGTKVEVAKVFNSCALIKYKDEFGWVWKNDVRVEE